MFGGNNENPVPQVVMNDSQFQYQTNTSLNQLHFLGTGMFLIFVHHLVQMLLELYRAKAFSFVCGCSESWLYY